MSFYLVYSHCLTCKYKSTLCSKTTIFIILCSFLTIVIPLLLAYRSHGFWLKSATYREQPYIRYTGNYLFLLETSDITRPVLCSSFPNFSEMVTDGLNQCVLVKTRENDFNLDGLLDELIVEFMVNTSEIVNSVEIILFLDYKLQKQCLLEMTSVLFSQSSTSLPSSRLDIYTDIALVQRQTLRCRGRDIRYKNSLTDLNSFSTEQFQTSNLIREYITRNVSIRTENVYTLWSRGLPVDDVFCVTLHVRFPEQTITYRPGFWQVMKWAWIQYLSLLIITLIIGRYVKCYVFKNHLLPSVLEMPWKKYN